jgi:hypothetical protein
MGTVAVTDDQIFFLSVFFTFFDWQVVSAYQE